MTVTRTRAALVLGMVLLWAVTPSIACLLPGHVPAPVVKQCCHQAAEDCGQTSAPVTHACCNAPTRPDAVLVLPDTRQQDRDVTALVISESLTLLAVPAHVQNHSPFGSPPGDPVSFQPSVLRI